LPLGIDVDAEKPEAVSEVDDARLVPVEGQTPRCQPISKPGLDLRPAVGSPTLSSVRRRHNLFAISTEDISKVEHLGPRVQPVDAVPPSAHPPLHVYHALLVRGPNIPSSTKPLP
jgi:hypothetical protein